VYTQKFDANGNPAVTYFLPRAGAVKSLAVGYYSPSLPPNTPELFAIGLNDQLYAEKFDDNGNSISDYFLTQPGAILTIRMSP
jgi:hypothetical protein